MLLLVDVEKVERFVKIGFDLSVMYGFGEYCSEDGMCKSLVEMSFEMVILCDVDKLLEYWLGWCEVFKFMVGLYVE